MVKNSHELERLLDSFLTLPKETEWLEFKEAKNSLHVDVIGKYFSALSNEANLKEQSCGWLIFGVNDRHIIVGTQFKSNRAELDKLKSIVAQNTTDHLTFMEIYEIRRSSHRVIMFQIPAAPRGIPIAWKGHYYGRNDEQQSALNIQEIEQIRNQVHKEDWSKRICKDANLDDLDLEAIQKAREEFKKKTPGLVNDIDDWDNEAFLNKAKVTICGQITNAAILLLGKPEADHFLSPAVARISWILKDAKNNELDYEHFGPPFILNVERLFKKIRNLNYRYIPNITLFPIEVTQYDPWVIREALHNCIAHQDYNLHGRVNVVERPDELLFANVGSFIPGSVEKVVEQDSPSEIYRNPFLSQAMVNLNMIDTIGSGIKKMFQAQRRRFFPLPDYDLLQPEKVVVKIHGKILNENFTRLLIENTELDLTTAMLLDKVQKKKPITRDNHRILKTKNLVEGRYPKLYISSKLAKVAGAKADYVKYRAFDDQHYKDMIIAFISKYGSASRKDIDKLILDKLSDALNETQKLNKMSNLLYAMSKKDKIIKNAGSARKPKWILV